MKLTENFRLEEFVRSDKAKELGIDNTPDEAVVDNLKTLCENLLQPLHNSIGDMLQHEDYFIKITSGYRCKTLNDALGGSTSSFHLYGYAGDCELYINGKECNALLFHIVKMFNNATELIWEYGVNKKDTPHKNYPAWVHIAYNKNDDRKMVKVIL